MLKEAYTARELAEMKLLGWPTTKSGIIRLATRKNWTCRPRAAVGGGVEYLFATLPEDLRNAIIAKLTADAPIGVMPAIPTPPKKSDARNAAKIMILQDFYKYQKNQGLSQTTAIQAYPGHYRAHALHCPDVMPYNVYKTLCEKTLYRWLKKKPEELKGKYGGRKGTSTLYRANDGKVAIRIAALLSDNRHYNGRHIRDAIRAEFGNQLEVAGKMVDMPVLRSFERHVSEWKKENAQLFTAITAPGEFKNKMRIAVGVADAHIERLNQQWQIDASPADALCTDGRYSIYGIIDLWSRRVKFSVSKTAKTEASLLLVRKAIMDWGLPETIKTDNGSDFISHRFKTALFMLGIEQEISAPFSPEQKGFIERMIGNAQRDLMAILPGFSGHNVADRKRIQDQKEFAARLGESDRDAFEVEMTAEQLQATLNHWVEGYHNRVHSRTGEAPALRAAQWAEAVRIPENERALDILLAPLASNGGARSVTKSGIQIDNFKYISAETIPYIGKRVLVRHDPDDMGIIHAFDDNNNFLFAATNYTLENVDRKALSRELKAVQKAFLKEGKAPINQERRTMDRMATAQAILNVRAQTTIATLPNRTEKYSNHAMDEAARAGAKTPIQTRTREEALAQQERTRARMAEAANPKKEYKTAADYQAQLEELLTRREKGEVITEAEIGWLEDNQVSAWFKVHMRKRERERENNPDKPKE